MTFTSAVAIEVSCFMEGGNPVIVTFAVAIAVATFKESRGLILQWSLSQLRWRCLDSWREGIL